jgi:fluoride exporter
VQLLTRIVLVALGSAVGGLLRWGVAEAFNALFGKTFPWGTFFINVTGCIFIGWFLTLLEERLAGNFGGWLQPEELRLLVAVGFTGAYTTFSTFEFETNVLLRDRDGMAAMIYLFGSLFLGLVGVRLGILLARGR